MSRSKRLVGVANAAPHDMRHRAGGGSSPQTELIQPLVLLLLVLDVLADHGFIAADRRYEVPAGPEVLPHEVALALPLHPRQMDRALALDEADHLRTAYFGGIAIIMCTWSGIRGPSTIWLSFCAASLRNTSPRCWRNSLYKVLRRHFGIKIT